MYVDQNHCILLGFAITNTGENSFEKSDSMENRAR